MLYVTPTSFLDDFDEEICAAFSKFEEEDLKEARFHPMEVDATQPRGVFKPVPIRYTEPIIYGEGGPNLKIRVTENKLTRDMCEGYDPEIIAAFGHFGEEVLHSLPVEMDCSPPRGFLNPLPLRYSSTPILSSSEESTCSPSIGLIETSSMNSEEFDEISLGDSVEDEIQKPTSKVGSLLKRFLNLFRRMRL